MSEPERRNFWVRDESASNTPQGSRPPTPVSGFSSRPSTPTARRPFHYYGSIGRPPSNLDCPSLQPSRVSDAAICDQNNYLRYKYYSRLRRGVDESDIALLIPDHVIPNSFFYPLLTFTPDSLEGQSSIVTIFAIWNTMMGTSLLSMPWAVQHAGLVLGPIIMLVMFALMLYTAYRVLKLQADSGITGAILELPALLKLLLGPWAEYTTLLFSMLALVGACIAYYILMTNFLFSMIKFIDGEISRGQDPNEWRNYTVPGVVCPSLNASNASQGFPDPDTVSTFDEFWTLNLTAPLALLVFVFPLMNVRSPSFFMKFNALGTLSVVFIGVFIGVKVGEWGFNFDFQNPDSLLFVEMFNWDSAHILSGILALALFSHNVIITLMSTQKEPAKNGRDLSTAYVCVTLTYCLVGVPFWLGFPLPKFCIEDNLLNNFSGNDVLAAVARCFLLFQLTTVFPLLTYVIRAQFMFMLFETTYPGFWLVLCLNLFLAFVCVMFAVFLPHIGTIIRFAGAICSMVLVFALPCVAYMTILKRQKRLGVVSVGFHVLVIAFGLLNLVLQFFGGE